MLAASTDLVKEHLRTEPSLHGWTHITSCQVCLKSSPMCIEPTALIIACKHVYVCEPVPVCGPEKRLTSTVSARVDREKLSVRTPSPFTHVKQPLS